MKQSGSNAAIVRGSGLYELHLEIRKEKGIVYDERRSKKEKEREGPLRALHSAGRNHGGSA